MKVRQRVYLSVHSNRFTPDRINSELGLMADDSSVRGSRDGGSPPVPRQHIWKLYSGASDTSSVDVHLAALFERITPAFDALKKFVEHGEHSALIQIVWYFEPGAEDDTVLAAHGRSEPSDVHILRGQHPLLGFGLQVELISRLASLGLAVDFDEYGDEYE